MKVSRDQLHKFNSALEKETRRRQRIEADEQVAFTQWCAACLPDDVLYFSIPNERKPSDQLAALMKMGLRPGAADYGVVFVGKLHFIEFKAPDGKQTEKQVAFEDDAKLAGAKYAVCRSWREAVAQITEWGIPHREVV